MTTRTYRRPLPNHPNRWATPTRVHLRPVLDHCRSSSDHPSLEFVSWVRLIRALLCSLVAGIYVTQRNQIQLQLTLTLTETQATLSSEPKSMPSQCQLAVAVRASAQCPSVGRGQSAHQHHHTSSVTSVTSTPKPSFLSLSSTGGSINN